MRINARAANDAEAIITPLPLEVPERLCRKLSVTHYENFIVGSFLLPKALRQDVYNIYSYCRICDDLADETGDPQLSIRLLEWWREELELCYQGKSRHPVFVALSRTIERHDIPKQPFEDLIAAFLQDQRVTRYQTFDDLLGYCANSANPVGRLFLHLVGYRDEVRQKLADSICTALQLTNFWQDVGVDYSKGRIYIPLEDMERFGYTENELSNHIVNASFVRLMRFEIARTRELFQQGSALCRLISGMGAADVELFVRGGLVVLRSIERHNYNVFRHRCFVSKFTKLMLLAGWCSRHLLGRLIERSN